MTLLLKDITVGDLYVLISRPPATAGFKIGDTVIVSHIGLTKVWPVSITHLDKNLVGHCGPEDLQKHLITGDYNFTARWGIKGE